MTEWTILLLSTLYLVSYESDPFSKSSDYRADIKLSQGIHIDGVQQFRSDMFLVQNADTLIESDKLMDALD